MLGGNMTIWQQTTTSTVANWKGLKRRIGNAGKFKIHFAVEIFLSKLCRRHLFEQLWPAWVKLQNLMSCDWFQTRNFKTFPLQHRPAVFSNQMTEIFSTQLQSAINQNKSLYLTAIWCAQWLNAELEQRKQTAMMTIETGWTVSSSTQKHRIKATRFHINIHNRKPLSPSLHTLQPLEI